MNSPEYIGYNYLRYLFTDADMFQAIESFGNLKIEDLQALERYFRADSLADYVVLPKNFLFSKIQ